MEERSEAAKDLGEIIPEKTTDAVGATVCSAGEPVLRGGGPVTGSSTFDDAVALVGGVTSDLQFHPAEVSGRCPIPQLILGSLSLTNPKLVTWHPSARVRLSHLPASTIFADRRIRRHYGRHL